MLNPARSSLRLLAVGLVVAVAVTVSACGGSAGHSPNTATRTTGHVKHAVQPGHVVLPHDQIQVGDTVTCDGAGATVLPPGQSTAAFADGTTTSVDLTVTTEQNGDVKIDCTSG
jgi:hypothetical protein